MTVGIIIFISMYLAWSVRNIRYWFRGYTDDTEFIFWLVITVIGGLFLGLFYSNTEL